MHLWRRMISIFGHKWSSHYGVAVREDGELSESARMWQRGLAGLSVEQIKRGLDVMISGYYEWPPSLPKFRGLCLCPLGVPSLADCVRLLSESFSRQGSLVDRYRHPLVLALAKQFSADGYVLRTANEAVVSKRIKSAYDALILSGWGDWPEGAQDVQERLCVKPDKARALSALADIRGVLGRV